MIVNTFNDQTALAIHLPDVERLVQQILLEEGARCEEVDINFVDTLTICQLHHEYFDDPTPTDCITFPLDEDPDSPYRVLGECFICPETALEYAKAHKTDPYEELTLYVVHCMLHLLGLEDETPEAELLMRQAEERQMKIIRHLDLILKKSDLET